LPGINNGQCIPMAISSNNVYNEITISNGILTDGSDVRIATTIIHELIHAFLNVIRVNSGISIPTLVGEDLSGCLANYYNGINNPLSQHNFMTDYMAPIIAAILNDMKDILFTPLQIYRVEHPDDTTFADLRIYQPTATFPAGNSGIATPWIWSDFFMYTSYEGLQTSDAFNTIFPFGSVGKYYFDQYYRVGVLVFNP